MKLYKSIFGVFALLLIFSANILAQDTEMTEEQWEAQMANLRAQKTALTSEIASLKADIANLKNTEVESYDDCMNKLYDMLGVTPAMVDNYRRSINSLDGKISAQQSPKTDRQKDLDALKMNKMSALPEFYTRVHKTMQRDLDTWVDTPPEINYTVVRGDHLWGIAKKKEHYGNGFAWPMIYKANRDKIKNPDLIYPKQVFKIPNLTEEEKAKYDKIRRNYKPAPVQ
ncbi:MAG: peptidoglycan-binding protein LysM [Ignavibacteriales bacterium CG12_big_fil_rev_8_21_14_0_65_30_8]|nr:MAG: peptidoglycan-binding protein LysM [Ignavibacteriales bacterium CG12_big_fil_rev_8_21_14_0_65_30_8]